MTRKYDPEELALAITTWPKVNTSGFDPQRKAIYESRKKAIELYAQGETLPAIEKITGIGRQNLTRLIGRCIEPQPDGSIRGFSGLVPYSRSEETKRKPSKYEEFCRENMDILRPIVKVYFESDNGFEPKQKKNIAFSQFVKELIASGHPDFKYPFTLKDNGRRAFYKFLDRVEDITENGLHMGRLSDDAKRLVIATRHEGSKLMRKPVRPFSNIEFDGHKIDSSFVISFKDAEGTEFTVNTKRIWLVAAIDVATRAIVGYSISVNDEYNRLDVIDCLRSVTFPPEFEKGEPFLPGHYLEEARLAVPSVLSMDNALANLSNDVISSALELGIAVRIGPVAKPTGRPHVERAFKTIEEMVFHRLSSTTGSNQNDPRRNKPEKAARVHCISIDDCHRLVRAGIRDYNNRAHSSLKGYSPLEMMRARVRNGILPAYVSGDIAGLYCITEKRTVRAYKDSGHAPGINIYGHRYTSQRLKADWNMRGKKLILRIDPKDISEIYAYRENGEYYDTLNIKGDLQNRSISLRQMELLAKHMSQRKAEGDMYFGSVDDVLDNLKERSKVSKKEATKLAQLAQIEEGFDYWDEEAEEEHEEIFEMDMDREADRRRINSIVNKKGDWK